MRELCRQEFTTDLGLLYVSSACMIKFSQCINLFLPPAYVPEIPQAGSFSRMTNLKPGSEGYHTPSLQEGQGFLGLS